MEMDREAMGGRERQRMAAKTIMIMLMINNDTQSLSPSLFFCFFLYPPTNLIWKRDQRVTYVVYPKEKRTKMAIPVAEDSSLCTA